MNNTPTLRRSLLALALAAAAAPVLAQPKTSKPAEAPWPTKPVRVLVGFPAGSTPDLVARTIARMTGGTPVWREGVVTDNGGWILDVHGLALDEPEALEAALETIAGVIGVGLFARRPADVVIVGDDPPWAW